MPEKPLWERVYFDEAYADIVRMVGYAGINLIEAQKKIQELMTKYDKERLKVASDQLVDIDPQKEFVTLKAETRKIATQLLGFPPEHKSQSVAAFLGLEEPNGPPKTTPRGYEKPVPGADASKESRSADSPKSKRTRKKKSDTVPAAPNPGSAAEPRHKPQFPPGIPATSAENPRASFMDQYREAKERHPGMLLLFRMGDFYEMFESDAEEAAKLLGLTLTSRDKVSMAGFPAYQLEAYLKKLLHEGKRVAICDQVDSSDGKSVSRVVTPA